MMLGKLAHTVYCFKGDIIFEWMYIVRVVEGSVLLSTDVEAVNQLTPNQAPPTDK